MKGLLILGAIAGFAYYKYSKMSAEQKRDIVNNLKEKGKKLYDNYVPNTIKETVAKA
jgi:hypothetical protein